MRWVLALGFAGSLLLWPGTSASASPLPPEPVEVSPSSSESPSAPEPSPESVEVPVSPEAVEDPPVEEPPPSEPPAEQPPSVTVVQLSDEDRILITTGFSLMLLVTTAGTVRLLTK